MQFGNLLPRVAAAHGTPLVLNKSLKPGGACRHLAFGMSGDVNCFQFPPNSRNRIIRTGRNFSRASQMHSLLRSWAVKSPPKRQNSGRETADVTSRDRIFGGVKDLRGELRCWSVFAEHDFAGFGTRTVNFVSGPNTVGTPNSWNVTQNIQSALAGVNWHLKPW
jgi:hypothetical protein